MSNTIIVRLMFAAVFLVFSISILFELEASYKTLLSIFTLFIGICLLEENNYEEEND